MLAWAAVMPRRLARLTAALALAGALDPDVVLMDVAMPDLDGITMTAALRRIAPRSAVVIHSLHDDAATRARAHAAGAAAFVAKHETEALLLPAIRDAVSPAGTWTAGRDENGESGARSQK